MPGIAGRIGRRWVVTVVLSAAMLLQGCAGASRRVPPAPRFANTEIEAAYKEGEVALLNGDYVKARRVLTQIISRYPGENDLAQVQWLIARSYDLEGRPLEAVAEYKRFLANFPDHPNAQDADDHIRRLERALRPKSQKPLRVLGTLSTDYEYGRDLSPDPVTTLNRVTTRLDAQVRNLDNGRGKLIFSGLRSFDLEDNRNDRARLQKLYGDWRNAADTVSVRAGRQPSTAGSLSTRYDGAELHYRVIPTVALDVSAGFPVDLSRSGAFSTDARFYEAGFSALDLWGATGRVYAVRQYAESVLDREAVGGNFQGVWGRVGVSGNVDYDVSFGDFNDRFLSVDYALRESLHVIVARDVRNDPYLQLGTALQDPAAIAAGIDAVPDIVALLGEDAVRDLTQLYTIDSTDTRAGVRWTIGSHWLLTTDYSHTISRITQAGGNRTDRAIDRVSVYAAQTNAWQVPDTASVLVVYQDGSDLAIDTLSLTAGERLAAAVLLQLKARVEYTNFKNGGTSDSLRYVPGLVINWEPVPFLSLTAEGEYTREDRFNEPGRTAVFSRLNATVLF